MKTNERDTISAKPTRKVGMVEAWTKHVKVGCRIKWMGSDGVLYPATVTKRSYTPGDLYAIDDQDRKEYFIYIENVREIETEAEILTLTGRD